LLAALKQPLTEIHKELAGRGEVFARYDSALSGDDRDTRRQSFVLALEAVRKEELLRRKNLVGPQRDELHLEIDGHPARTVASQGQVRTLALALKLAELAVAKASGEAPLMLVDDLSSELDSDRIGRLVRTLRSLDAQVFVTTTDPTLILKHCRSDTLAFLVSSGKVDSTPRGG
jgi:DNA replication and repair protein RecF